MSLSDKLFTHIIGDKSTVYTEIEVDAVDVLATTSEKEIPKFPQSYTDVKKAHHEELILQNTPLFSEYSELPQSYVAFVNGLLDVCYSKDEQTQLVELCSNLVSVLLTQTDLEKELFEKVYSIIPFEDEEITEYILHFNQTGDTPREIYTILAFYGVYTLDSLLYEIEKSSSNTTKKSDNMKRGERKNTRRSTDEFKVDVDSESGEITREESDSTITDTDTDTTTDNITKKSNLDGNEESEDVTTDDSERFIYNNTEDTNDIEPDNSITLLYTFDLSKYDSIDTYNEFISIFLKQTAPAITELSGFNSFVREMLSLALTNRDLFNEVIEALSGNAPEQDSQDYITIRETYPDIYTNIFLHFLQQYLLAYINNTE